MLAQHRKKAELPERTQVDIEMPKENWQKEAILGFFSGICYGATNAVVGQPFDTVKCRMQTQSRYMSGTARDAFFKLVRSDGLTGLYKGGAVNAAGVMVQRSFVQGSFQAFYAKWETDAIMSAEIPFTNGLQLRTLAAALIAGTVRSVLECPFEYTKVRLQTG